MTLNVGFFKRYWIQLTILSLIVGYFSFPRIIDGFSSSETICHKCLADSKYKHRIGAICTDGWQSKATGKGACSHHGGVREWIYGESYRKSHSECMEYAKNRSWIE